jgi:hypothetical protein
MTLRSWIRRPPRHERLQSGKRKGPPALWYLKNVDGPQCLVSFQATTGSRCFLVRYERDVAVAYADLTS